MTDELDRLAGMAGIEPKYLALNGEITRTPDAAKRAVLKAMGIPASDAAAVEESLGATTAVPFGPMGVPEGPACFMPEWLKDGRSWGIACQLYGLRSERNWGIGDFEDLGRFAEIAAAAGADFVGVNPLHALFLADPERCSPFFPSNRQFLNPLYIALDKVPGAEMFDEGLTPPAEESSSGLVDYRAVGALKRKALDRLFRIFSNRPEDDISAEFERFCVNRGRSLYLHALFEALSEAMVQQGHGATWHGWPEDYRQPGTDAVRAFAEEQKDLVSFHSWLQFIADRQVGEAQARARAAGMRIGLYLDLAVGVAPDGSATWSDRDITVPGARIGAPPDYYNAAGQDWGLAPLSPAGLIARDFLPYRESMDNVVRYAGALRIDHAMSLYRLFWIAEGMTAADGAYVRYPFQQILQVLAEVSQERRAIVIGEDLGVVPEGFRDVMQKMEILSYRVFFFEKKQDHFVPVEDYPREALACITTHDLHTLGGWWSGRDIEVRHEIGMIKPDDLEKELDERAHERRRVLGALSEKNLLPEDLRRVMQGEAEPARELPDSLAVALHRLVALTPSRLFAVAAEDLAGSIEQVNVPGTMDEYPNWRRKLPIPLEDLPTMPLFQSICAAIQQERPRS